VKDIDVTDESGPLDDEIESLYHEDRWLMSYSDLMTLLFGMFVLLYATATQFSPVQKSIQNTFSSQTSIPTAAEDRDGDGRHDSIDPPVSTSTPTSSSLEDESLRAAPCRLCAIYIPIEVNAATRSSFQIPSSAAGPFVFVSVQPGGPAYESGLRTGDILFRKNGVPFTAQTLKGLEIERSPLNSEITYDFFRGGRPSRLVVKLDSHLKRVFPNSPQARDFALKGWKASEIVPEKRAKHYIPINVQGVMIDAIPGVTIPEQFRNSALTNLNGKEISDLNSFIPAIIDLENKRKPYWFLLVKKDRQHIFFRAP
jgi:hypothetical protein